MRVKIGKYKNWFGPYQLAEKILFFIPKKKDEYGFKHTSDIAHKFGEFLAYGSIEDDNRIFREDRETTWLNKLLVWIDDKKKRKVHVKIDPWDTWSMDHTLALIILPMLKQLRESKHGAPMVDYDDVPEHLHPTKEEIEKIETDGTTDSKFFDRWNYVMDEMIFAFEHQVDDTWEDKFTKGKFDMISVPCEWDENGKPKLFRMEEGPNHTYECDYDAMKKVQERIDNGLKLFGKYYRSLWD
jgi:hypothetical protein